MSEGTVLHVLALKVDPAWRRLPDAERVRDAAAFTEAATEAARRVTAYTYSTVGTRAEMDLLFWRLGHTLEEVEESAALLLRSGLGRWCAVAHSMVGIVRPSQYVKRPTVQEQAMFTGERRRYLVVYPFVKTIEWHLLSAEERRAAMAEHIRIGHDFPQVQQLLAYSIGIDDQEWIVAYETDDLVVFQDLVIALRATEARRSTLRDTPILTCVRRPLDDALRLIG